ncbi:thioesterase family protein [Geodermatophilus maliterrae]|uniref:Thioesterase family protein n=1 Tax=Geodermatophilus maliterrae TaxID=3162531 RepID=A0ABV3XG68_9ACTN
MTSHVDTRPLPPFAPGPATSEFDVDTAVSTTGPGRFAARITDRWNALGGGPDGGYLLTPVLRAMAVEVPGGTPLVVSASYLAAARPGEAAVCRTTLRVGRRFTTAEASLSQGDRQVVHAVATFAGPEARVAPGAGGGAAPDVSPPEDCAEPLAGVRLPGVSITDRIHHRFPEVPGWWRGRPTGNASMDVWMRFRDGRDADPVALALLVDAAPPAVLELGAPASTTLRMTVHLRARPTPGWLLARVATRHVIDGHHEEDVEIRDRAGRLVAQSRQLAVLPAGRPLKITGR